MSIISAVLFLSGVPSYALPIEETAEDSARVKDIEEVVIVYSPKETGKLRQAPIAVSLFDRAALDDQHTASLKELSAFVPNFYMPDYGSSLTSAAYIRGIGSRINTPAVGLYVDNVGYADKSAYDIELLDVERVDVLRGPQATLYGRNAMGGLLRVFTRNPFHYQGTNIRLGTSVKDKGYQLSASHYQKTSHRMAYALSGFYKHSEGFFENVTRHETVGGSETGGGRVRVIYLPAESRELASQMGTTASQVRQDFNCIGDVNGRQGIGYSVENLLSILESLLFGNGDRLPTILIGCGRLGKAVSRFITTDTNGYKLIAAFDVAENEVGKEISGIRIRHIDELEAFCEENKPKVAVLCVPRDGAQQVSGRLVDLGIEGFWNFSHYDLSVSYPNVVVENVHLGDSLMSLGYRLRNQE